MTITKLSNFLKRTPFHPQWLVFRKETFDFVVQAIRPGHTRILDIGCGKGRLREKMPDNTYYVGLDYPPTGIGLYQTEADILCTAEALPLAHQSFDIVACLEVMEHLPNPAAAAREISRVLRPGGYAMVSVPFAYPLHDIPFDYQRLTAFQLTRIFERTGRQVQQLEETGHALESAALLANLALAKTVLDGIHLKRPAALLLPLLLIQVPFANLIGRIAAVLAGNCGKGFLPTGYRLLLRKP